ncbi:MAG: hypothetical protein K2Y39_18700 [Candidatus Obscuribacterales bacterium]|nr:hypothetical protein [Candidatus Obscuribacterales bacterium]
MIEITHPQYRDFLNLVAAYNSCWIRSRAAGDCPAPVQGRKDWTCCALHRQLLADWGRVEALAFRFLFVTTGRYSNDDDGAQIFSPLWWTSRGMNYDEVTRLVSFSDERTCPLDFCAPDFTSEELLTALREFCPPDRRKHILSLKIVGEDQDIELLYADNPSSGWVPFRFWGRLVRYSTPCDRKWKMFAFLEPLKAVLSKTAFFKWFCCIADLGKSRQGASL